MPETVKFTTDSLDNVEETLRPFYTEGEDGKFHLNGDEGTLADYSLTGALFRAKQRSKDDLAAVRAERDDLKSQLSNLPEDFDPEKWAKLKEGKVDEAAVIKLRQTLEAERDEWKTKFEGAIESARKTAIERDLSQLLSAGGVKDAMHLQASILMLSDTVEMQEDGTFLMDIGLAPMQPDEAVQRWLAGKGQSFVDRGTGGNARGGEGGGASKKWNEMSSAEKTALYRSDPQEYERAKEAA